MAAFLFRRNCIVGAECAAWAGDTRRRLNYCLIANSVCGNSGRLARGSPFICHRCLACSEHTMTNNPTDTELVRAILAAITEAREHGVPDERIAELLAEIVNGLREGLSQSTSRVH